MGAWDILFATRKGEIRDIIEDLGRQENPSPVTAVFCTAIAQLLNEVTVQHRTIERLAARLAETERQIDTHGELIAQLDARSHAH